MRKWIRYRLNILNLELDVSWPSFAISSLIALLLITYSILLLNTFSSIRTGFGPEGPSNIPRVEFFVNTLNRDTINAMGISTSIMNYLIISIIPLVMSITFASSFENGNLRNLLSMPIARKSVFFIKFIILFSVITIPSVFGLLIGTFWFLPNSASLKIHVLLSISLILVIFFNTSISMLVAVQTKSLMKSTFLSLSICYILFLSSSANLIPGLMLGVVNPIHATNIYLGILPTVQELTLGLNLLLLSLEGCLVISLLLLTVSVISFDKIEIE